MLADGDARVDAIDRARSGHRARREVPLTPRHAGSMNAIWEGEEWGRFDVRQTRKDPLILPARLPDGRWTVDAWAPLDGRVVNGGIRIAF